MLPLKPVYKLESTKLRTCSQNLFGATCWYFSSESKIIMQFFSTIMSSHWVMLIWIVQVRANFPPGGPTSWKGRQSCRALGQFIMTFGWPNHTSDFCGTKTSSDMACRSIGTDGVGSPAIWSRGVLPKGSCLLLGTGAWKTKLLRHATTSKHQRHKIYSIFPGYLLPRVGGRREKECPKFKYAQCSGHNF